MNMTENKKQRIKAKIKTLNLKESAKDYVTEHFQDFGFPNKKAVKQFCMNELKTE